MRLNIKNIGKIHDSTIEISGITVIAGENSTGKSTFSKVLYCMFNAFYDTETAILNERVNHIRRIVDALGWLRRRKLNVPPNYLIKEFIAKMKSKNNEEISENDIRKFLFDVLNFTDEKNNDTVNNMVKDIKRSLLTTEEEIQTIIISGYFWEEFEEQINHVNKPQSKGEVLLTIKGKNINVNVENNECNEFEDNVGILHDAIYIDTPFIIDEMSMYNSSMNYIRNHRENLCYRFCKEQSDDSIIQKAIIEQKIKNILTYIAPTINGEFEKEEGELKFREKNFKKSIPFYNVSAGIKTFLIIKRLLELGEIKERGVLIFDEPEIHLHPGWQLKFAEILVLLQKEFDLTILLTTHSPYFINAIEVYGKKYDIKKRINFYLAENQGDLSDVKNVTNKLDVIYKQLAEPFREIEKYED